MGFCRNDSREDKMYMQQGEEDGSSALKQARRDGQAGKGGPFPGVWKIRSQEQEGDRMRVLAQEDSQLWWYSPSRVFSGHFCFLGEMRTDMKLWGWRRGQV